MIVIAHFAMVTSLRHRQERLLAALDGVPPRYRDHALPRLEAAVFDDGGWGFRIGLALPAIVATIAMIVVAGA